MSTAGTATPPSPNAGDSSSDFMRTNVKNRAIKLRVVSVVNGRVGAGPSPRESSKVAGVLGAGFLRQRDTLQHPGPLQDIQKHRRYPKKLSEPPRSLPPMIIQYQNLVTSQPPLNSQSTLAMNLSVPLSLTPQLNHSASQTTLSTCLPSWTWRHPQQQIH